MDGESVALGFGAVLLLGLGFGAGPCNIACLPYLGPVLLASRSGARDGWRVLLPFSLGRLTGYACVGLVAGMAGHLATGWLESPAVRWILGGATVLVALALWLRLRRRTAATVCAEVPQSAIHVQPPGQSKPLLPGALFLMGAGMAFNPCAPLSTVMLAAAASASAASGLWLGIGFGLGAVLVPALVLGLGVAHLGHEMMAHLPDWRPAIERLSVVLLVAMGLSTAMGWMLP
jgi:cytochrome c biogenesis protein CcdA